MLQCRLVSRRSATSLSFITLIAVAAACGGAVIEGPNAKIQRIK
jgi:hypothetical protein